MAGGKLSERKDLAFRSRVVRPQRDGGTGSGTARPERSGGRRSRCLSRYRHPNLAGQRSPELKVFTPLLFGERISSLRKSDAVSGLESLNPQLLDAQLGHSNPHLATLIPVAVALGMPQRVLLTMRNVSG